MQKTRGKACAIKKLGEIIWLVNSKRVKHLTFKCSSSDAECEQYSSHEVYFVEVNFFLYFWCASPNVWGNLHNTCLLIFKYAFLKKSEWNNFFCLHRLIPKDQCFHSRRRRAADVTIVWLPCPDDHVTHYIQYHPPNMIHLHLCQTHLNKRKEKNNEKIKFNKQMALYRCLFVVKFEYFE